MTTGTKPKLLDGRFAHRTQQTNYFSKFNHYLSLGYTLFRNEGKETVFCNPKSDAFEFLTITLLEDGLILEDINVVKTVDLKTLYRHAERMSHA